MRYLFYKNVGLQAMGHFTVEKRQNSSKPMHRELFNLSFNHLLHKSIGILQVWVDFNGECT